MASDRGGKLVPASESLAPILTAPSDRPFVVAQLGQSLDGRIATISGESRWINRQDALIHLHRLRAAVDAVVVGVGTVIADDPMLNVRHVDGTHPARIVIDPGGRLPVGARCLSDDGAQRIVISSCTPSLAGGIQTIQLAAGPDGHLCPRLIVDTLFARGLRRLLIEGGARTVSGFIDAGAVDRLHLLIAPVILGSGKSGLSLRPIERLSQALRPRTRVHVLPDGDVLFDCDLRSTMSESAGHGHPQ
jgi:riboflavin-specific deaminase-like protein